MMLIPTLVLAFGGLQAPAVAAASDASQVTLATPQTVTALDTGKLKGEPAILAWSPDMKQLYLQTVERGRGDAVKTTRHYVITLDSKQVKDADQPPAWAMKYWTWKAGQASPAEPAFRIGVEQRLETVTATATPRGGDLARGGLDNSGGPGGSGGGTSVNEAASAAFQSQTQTIYALKLKGETVGEWTNEAVTPGVNFTWAPAPMRLFAFAKRGGGPLFVVDDSGRKAELDGARSAVLPAWSDDGTRMAWLEKRDKKHYDLMVAAVGHR
jgi:hypothetical protein